MTPSNSTIAITMIVLSAFLFSIMDAITKHIGGFISVVLVLWVRYSIQAGLMAIWIGRTRGPGGFATKHPRFQVLRGLLLLAISVLAFLGLRSLPLAEFTAIIMLSPILVTAVAGWMLKEPVGRMRWALVSGGFIGTLIVIRPGSGLFGAAVALPLLAMLVSTGYSLLTSRLAVLENPYTTQFYTGITGSLLLLPLVLLQAGSLPGILHGLSWVHLSLLLVIGILGSFGHLMLVMAFSRAGTASLMPFTYTQIGFAAMMSWLVFRHAPDFWAWIGMATIATCGAATAWLNLQSAQRAR